FRKPGFGRDARREPFGPLWIFPRSRHAASVLKSRRIAGAVERRYAHFMAREAAAPETFRPWVALRTVVMAADTLWIGVFCALAVMQGATRSAFLSAAFFVALFTACSIFYNRLSFTVSESGLTVRTL